MNLVIIDGYSLIYRCYYGVPFLSTSSNIPTNAIYGFTNILFKIYENVKPDYICIAFDSKKIFRKESFEEYKANRKPMPDELSVQLPYIKDILNAMKINMIEIEGYEADDIIGSISYKFKNEDIKIIIFTGDRDLLQLIDKNISVNIITTKFDKTIDDIYTIDNIKEKFGVHSNQVIDYKALVGDQSDNIPGIKGIGPKTAIKLIEEYCNLDNIYKNIDNISGSVKQKLLENKEDAYLSKNLATIIKDIPINISLEQLRISNWDYMKLYDIFKSLEFKSFIDKINKEIKINEEENKITEKTPEQLSDQDIIKYSNCFSILFDERQDIFYIYDLKKLYITKDINVIEKIISYIKKYIITFDFKKILHKINYNKQLIMSNIFDLMIATYVLDSNRKGYDLENILLTYLNIDLTNINYHQAVLYFNNLKDILEKQLIEYNCFYLFKEIEMPLIYILYIMEKTGVMVDEKSLFEYENEILNKIKDLEDKIFTLAGQTFNINSPKQLASILFENLKLPVIKKTKTGYSTDAEVLEHLIDKHPIIADILDYRMFNKIYTTYCIGLRNSIDNKSSRIHTSFIQTGTATGRLSSTEPNLQNIPIKYPEGKLIRKVFVPQDGFILIDADYSQIELRILAHLSKDENLIKAFINNEDIHLQTASEIFGVQKENVTPLMRSQAKAVNFGIVYGISDFGLSRDLGISVKEANEYIQKYFDRYPKVKEYLDFTIDFAKKNGYVLTLFNRRRYIKDINSSNRNLRQYSERIAMNSPIQGTAADIIKLAMIKIYKQFEKYNLKSRLLLQVHDELLIEAAIEEKENVKEIIKTSMENATQLSVPLIVDCKEGVNWYEAK